MKSLKSKSGLNKYVGKLILVQVLMLVFFSKSYSQSPNRRETLDFLNHSLGAQTQLAVKGGNLIVTIKNNLGELVREDVAPLAELETNAYYEQESGLLYVPCIKNAEGCVTKTLYLQKIKRPAERISIKTGEESQFKSLQKGIEHLIRIETEIGYKDEISLE